MHGKSVYIRPKVVGSFPGPSASGSYMHQAALYTLYYTVFTRHYYYFDFIWCDIQP
jgi:hypothetical protein